MSAIDVPGGLCGACGGLLIMGGWLEPSDFLYCMSCCSFRRHRPSAHALQLPPHTTTKVKPS